MGDRSRFDIYTREEIAELAEAANLTPPERQGFEARAKGASVVCAAMDLCMSERTVERCSARTRKKIARVMHRRREIAQPCEEIAGK